MNKNICICIKEPNFSLCKKLLVNVEVAEIRLDGASLPPNEIQQIFSLPSQLIATCRPNGKIKTKEARKMALLTAIVAGAAYVDLEIESDANYISEIIQTARLQECLVILSYHNYEMTPTKKQLEDVVAYGFSKGADIVKISSQVNNDSENARLLSLYDTCAKFENKKIIAFGMGEKGKISRLAAPLLGAPFVYASPEIGGETGPGQMKANTMLEIYNLLNAGKSERRI